MNAKQILLVTSLFLTTAIKAEDPFANIPEYCSQEEAAQIMQSENLPDYTNSLNITLDLYRVCPECCSYEEWKEITDALANFAKNSENEELFFEALLEIIKKGYKLSVANNSARGRASISAHGIAGMPPLFLFPL